jgi:hypothetical protein
MFKTFFQSQCYNVGWWQAFLAFSA